MCSSKQLFRSIHLDTLDLYTQLSFHHFYQPIKNAFGSLYAYVEVEVLILMDWPLQIQNLSL